MRKSGNLPKYVKYPDNRRFMKLLKRNDIPVIAQKSGMSPITVKDMIRGIYEFNDKVKKAIIEVFEERRQLDQRLDEIANQGGAEE